MSLLIPDIGLLFWMSLSFAIVFFILAKFAFPIILQSVEKRNNYINESLEAAREAENKLATISQQADALLEEARKERQAMLEETLETQKKMKEEALKTSEGEIRLLKEKAMAEIEESRRKAFEEMRDQFVDVSVKIAGKVIRKELDNDKKQEDLIKRLLEEEAIYKS